MATVEVDIKDLRLLLQSFYNYLMEDSCVGPSEKEIQAYAELSGLVISKLASDHTKDGVEEGGCDDDDGT